MSDEQQLKNKIKDWIVDNSRSPDASGIDFDTAILEKKIISSLKVMELIVYLESLSGKPVQADQLKPGTFSSINSIYTNFLGR